MKKYRLVKRELCSEVERRYLLFLMNVVCMMKYYCFWFLFMWLCSFSKEKCRTL